MRGNTIFMFEALVIFMLSFAGLDGSDKAHYSNPCVVSEVQVKAEFDKNCQGLSYDDYKKAYYAALESKAADGGMLDQLAAD